MFKQPIVFDVMKLHATAYSYHHDGAVPRFSDGGPCTVMDAECGICARGATWIARNDQHEEFRIIPLQSDLGRSLISHYGMDPCDPTSWLYLEDGKAYSSLDAIIRVGERLGGIWTLLGALRAMPRPAQDCLYGLLARNRYRLGGRVDLCSLPDPEVRKRILN